jgi:Domain of Unknown Function (DUF748)
VSRFRRRTLVISAFALGALVVVLLVIILPLIVRRVAVDRLSRMTGRAVALADVDLNLFTGRVALHRFRLAQRGSDAPAFEIDRLGVRVALTSLMTSNVRVSELTLTAPRIYVARLGPGRFDFDDLLALIPPPDPNKPPAKSTTTVTLQRLTLERGLLVARDEAVAPTSTWRLEDVTIDGADLSTRPGARPGRLAVRARVNGAAIGFEADPVELTRTAVEARVSLTAFDVTLAAPYVPPTVPVVPTAGRLTLDLQVKTSRPPEGPLRLIVGGIVGLADVAVLRRGAPAPLLRVPRINVVVKDARPLDSLITLAALEVDGLDLSAVRDRQGQIDLLSLARPADTAAPPAPPSARPPASPPAGGGAPAPLAGETAAAPLRIAVERVALAKARFAFRDEAVSPVTTLTATDIGATVTNLAWPGSTPLALEVAFGLPTAGRLTVKGTATLAPFTADVTTSLRNGVIEPFQPYIPIKARLGGRFNGDSRSRVVVDAAGRVTATSKGTSWIEGLEMRNPADNSTPLKIQRFELAGIDFGWPTHARVATVTVRRPNVRIERDASGAIRLRELFEVQQTGATPAPAPPAPTKPTKPAKPTKPTKPAATKAPKADPVPPDVQAKGGAVGFPLDIGVFVLEDGYLQFLDRTVQPAFSETLSRLAIRIEGLSSTPGRMAKLTTQAIVGGDAALDVQGELAPLGELFADIRGELRDFTLARVNPYADSFVSWIVDRGKLGVRFHYRVERGQLEASNEIVIDDIHVAPSRQEDEVKKRIGLPLGLIVALITDANNDLKINLPMSGPLATWKADLGDAIWTVVKNVVVNIAAAPFRAIGRMFTSGDNKVESLSIEPITFPAGGDVIAGGMEQHLTKVADFLRRAPAIRLSLTPFASSADLDNLKGQELTARLQAVQREKKLPDFAAAVAAEFKTRFPTPPGTPPPAPDAQLARLREAEPLPDSKVTELLQRRVNAVREGLVKDQGIPEGRVRASEPKEIKATDTSGRVEFSIGQ